MARLGLVVALLASAWAVLASAWLCDDAWITLRSVDNLLAGYGLRWNPAERVQAFTHPLWALSLAAAVGVTGQPYLATIVLSLVASAAAVWLVVRLAHDRGAAALAVAALALSKAFVDFSTSGLENPLTHLLLAGFFCIWFADGAADSGGRRLWRLATLAALLATNRLDSVLLVAPALLLELTREGRRGLPPLLLGSLPFVAWELFALVYYGFPFPNTAYAKLATGIPAGELAAQGLHYLADTALRDPATALALALGCAAGARGNARDRAVALGIALSLVAVIWVGGDFMRGRFLTAPLLAAAALLARQSILAPGARRKALVAAVALLAAGFAGPRPTLLSGPGYGVGWPPDPGHHGIVDERAGYYPLTGLWRVLAFGASPAEHPWAASARRDRTRPDPVLLAGPVGLYGFHVGPGKHVVDEFALADPLRARLPVAPGRSWRIGHFPRAVPAGYVESLATGRNRLREPELAAAWDDLVLITRGPLFASARWRAIVRRNLEPLLQAETPESASP